MNKAFFISINYEESSCCHRENDLIHIGAYLKSKQNFSCEYLFEKRNTTYPEVFISLLRICLNTNEEEIGTLWIHIVGKSNETSIITSDKLNLSYKFFSNALKKIHPNTRIIFILDTCVCNNYEDMSKYLKCKTKIGSICINYYIQDITFLISLGENDDNIGNLTYNLLHGIRKHETWDKLEAYLENTSSKFIMDDGNRKSDKIFVVGCHSEN